MKAEEMLKSHKVRPTANRLIVISALMEHEHPMSIKEFEENYVNLDKSTIFRTLRLFAKHHLIHEIEDGSGALKYELCHSNHSEEHNDLHPHFFCELCKRTICLSNVTIPVVKFTDGSIVHSVNYVLKGICGDCCRRQSVFSVNEFVEG